MTHLQLPSDNSYSRVLVKLDIEKAFDSVNWFYMSAVLEVIGFGPRFRNWIKILYKAPLAQIKLGGELLEVFPIERGTRQGCPLSPVLFALMMEPIAKAIRNSPLIKGIQVGPISEKWCSTPTTRFYF